MNNNSSLLKSLRRNIEGRWYSDSPGWLALLAPLEFAYRAVAANRRKRLSATQRAFGVPVVVVGNIQVGGGGKTPTLIALVDALRQRGMTPGVVSRGYGREQQSAHFLSSESSIAESGDEARLIFDECGCPLVVASDREQAVTLLLERAEVDIVLSDDGLQHYSMWRDVEIAVFNRDAGFGNGHCLPVGPLREPTTRLREVDFVLEVVAATSAATIGDNSYPVQQLEKAWKNVRSGRQCELSHFKNSTALALCGLARPQKFFDTLSALGVNFEARPFPDHYRYSAADFAGIGERLCLMTAKDAVKCRDIVGDNCWALEIEYQLPSEFIDALLNKLKDIETP